MKGDHENALDVRHARYRQVLAWRAEGLAYPEIGRRLGVSRGRAHDLARQAQRWQERMHGTAPEPPAPTVLTLEMPVESLPITPNAKKSLRRAGLWTVGAVVTRSDAELLSLRSFGPATVAAIRAAVAGTTTAP
jgi:Bacterial RNA polymerase, alpha chain C terminal domain